MLIDDLRTLYDEGKLTRGELMVRFLEEGYRVSEIERAFGEVQTELFEWICGVWEGVSFVDSAGEWKPTADVIINADRMGYDLGLSKEYYCPKCSSPMNPGWVRKLVEGSIPMRECSVCRQPEPLETCLGPRPSPPLPTFAWFVDGPDVLRRGPHQALLLEHPDTAPGAHGFCLVRILETKHLQPSPAEVLADVLPPPGEPLQLNRFYWFPRPLGAVEVVRYRGSLPKVT